MRAAAYLMLAVLTEQAEQPLPGIVPRYIATGDSGQGMTGACLCLLPGHADNELSVTPAAVTRGPVCSHVRHTDRAPGHTTSAPHPCT